MSKLIRLYANNTEEDEKGSFKCVLSSSELVNIKAVALKTALFRNNVYNIDETNKIFTYKVGGVDRSVALTESGFYTADEILTIIIPLIDADIKTFSATDSITAVVGNYSFKIQATTVGVLLIDFDGVGGLNNSLGNTEASGDLTAGTYQFDSFPTLGGLESVTVNLNTKTPQTILNVSSQRQRITNSLGVIPVDAPFGGLQVYSQPDLSDAMLVFSYPEDISSIKFTLRDVNGDRVLNQTKHLVVELKVWF